MEKCKSTKQTKISKTLSNKRCSSADVIRTSSCVGAVTSLILLLACTIITSSVLNLLSTNNTYATNSTLSLSIDNTTISLDIAPTSANGDFAKSSNNTISVTTNNYSGYTLSIAASSSATNNTSLINSSDNTKVITSISSATSEADFKADTSTAATNYNGKWGYLPSKLNSAANTSFQPAPGTGNDAHVIDQTSVANASAANTYTIALGTRVGKDTVPGSYSNTFIISAVANIINYSIAYNKGSTSDTVSGLPANTNGTVADPLSGSTDVTLSSTAPTRAGYDFKGWCTALPTAGTGTSPDTCSGTTIASSGTYNLNAAANPSITLYAIWQKEDPIIYNKVAAMSKGKNTAENGFSWTSITTPTSINPSTDTSTSGVYEWGGKDGTGTSVDSNSGDKPIYFYRGILENSVSSYGSDGSAVTYPNYVVLSSASDKNGLATTDTCWRIVRTTSTGGVKMVYNGTWTGSTCANASTAAQTTISPFNTNSATVSGKAYTGLQYRNIHAVGYTYSNIAAGTTSTKTPAQLFGSSGNDTATNVNSSIIKQYIEDWYASKLTSYTSILEGDAGYCQDRRLNTGTTWTTPLAEDSNTIIPYGTSGMTEYYFGAYPRNAQSSTFDPLLTCPRGKVDLYSYSGDAGNGNGQLTYPVALLTADEASIAGDGWDSSFSAYSDHSYLRSGSDFWLLSPYYRRSVGYAYGFYLVSDGGIYYTIVFSTSGVRPAISLKPGTEAVSGTGIATNPWIVNPLPTMQEATASSLAVAMPNVGDTITLRDARDNQSYTVGKLADGKYWMTENLNIAGGTALSADDTNVTSAYIGSFSTSNNLTKTGNTIVLPTSSTSGFNTNNYSYVYNTSNKTSNCASPGCYSYYSWDAATLGSGRSISTDNTDAPYSICPKGWRLPSTHGGTNSSTDFRALMIALGGSETVETYSASTAPLGSTMSTTIQSFPNNFLPAGYYDSDSFQDGGPGGEYCSSTAYSGTAFSRLFDFGSSNVYSANVYYRRAGYSVRCLKN